LLDCMDMAPPENFVLSDETKEKKSFYSFAACP
jgi:hypothetical protein